MKSSKLVVIIFVIILFIGVCVACSQHDEEIEDAAFQRGYENGYENGRDDGYNEGYKDASYEYDEAYHEGFGDGVSEAYAGNAYIVDDNYLRIYEEGYADGKEYYINNLSELFSELHPKTITEELWCDYGTDIIEYINEYTGSHYVDIESEE